MTLLNHRLTEREETERARGFIIYLLWLHRPKPLQLSSAWKLLHTYNQPMLRRRFIQEVDHVRALGLIRVFPAGAPKELDEVEQAKLIQRYADAVDDQEMGETLSARLTTAGTAFQDGITDVPGVQRVQ